MEPTNDTAKTTEAQNSRLYSGDNHQLSDPNFRRNYLLGISNGVFYNTGLSFFNRTTIIPVYMSALGAPSVLIALTSLFESIGWHLPQFVASRFVVHKPQKLSLYRNAAIVRIFGLSIAFCSTFLFGKFATVWPLTLFVLGFGLFSVAGGFAGLVFTEILAKTVPKEKRGSYFGWRAILSGLIGLYIGVGVINPMLGFFPFPHNYATVYGVGIALIAISFVLFIRQREPHQAGLPPERGMRAHFSAARLIATDDKRFRRFVLFRALMMLWFAGLPFYILFAHDRLGVSEAEIGLFISWEFAGSIVANVFWSYVSNRLGNKLLLVIVCVLAVFVSGGVLLFQIGFLPTWSFGMIFAVSAAVDSGAGNGGINYALEIIPEPERPTYLGMMNSTLAGALIIAALAGGLRDWIGYTGLFGVTGVIALASLLTILTLPEPRKTSIVHA